MDKLQKYIQLSVIILSISVAAFFGAVLVSYVSLKERMIAVAQLREIKTGITDINMALRNAIIAPEQVIKDLELQKRFENRALVDVALKKISLVKLRPTEQQAYAELRLVRETTYSASQNHIAGLIQLGVNDARLWPTLLEHQRYQIMYTKHVDKLLNLIVLDIELKYKYLLEFLIGSIILVLIAANIGITYVARKPRNRRKCHKCEKELCERFSFTLTKVIADEVKPVRVCEKCYFENSVQLKLKEVGNVPS